MISLAEALYSLPTSRLRAVVRARDIEPKKLALVPDKRQLVHFLASELVVPVSVQAAITGCNLRQLRLLQIITAEDGPKLLSWREVVERAGGMRLEPVLAAVMEGVEERGLAFRGEGGVFVPDAVRLQVPMSLPDRYTIARCLEQYDAQTVKRIRMTLGLESSSDTKAANIVIIRDHLLADVSHDKLAEEEQDVLDYILGVGGMATALEVASAVLAGKTDDFFRYDWQNRWKQGKERNAIDRLLARGRLFVVSHSYGFNLYLIIPGDLLRAMTAEENKEFWTGPPPELRTYGESTARATVHSNMIRDIVSLLGILATQEAARTNTGHIHKASLKNIARSLSVSDDRYASFLYAISRSAGLIAPQGEKQIYRLTEAGADWLRADGGEQISALFHAWKNGAVWAEMYTDPLQKASEYRSAADMIKLRSAVLELLQERSPEPFIDITSVADAVGFRYPLLLVHIGGMGGDIVSSPTIFIRLLICECLAWLGMVELVPSDTGPTEDKEPARKGSPAGAIRAGQAANRPSLPEALAFRLTPLGARLLGNQPEAAEPTPREDQFILQANGEIFVPPYLEPVILYQLLLVSEVPAKASTGNTVSITRDAIRRALDRGDLPRDILAFLQAHARTGIPQNVEYLINEVGAKHGHIHIGQARMYLQVDSPMLLQELKAHREIKEYFIRALGDTVGLLRADDPDKLLRVLRKAGYLPVNDDASATPGITLKEGPRTQANSTVRKSKVSAPKPTAEHAIDWERMAREDGKKWTPAAAANGSLAKRGGRDIGETLKAAARNGEYVQIQYRRRTGGALEEEVVIPHQVRGNLAYVGIPGDGDELVIPIVLIEAADVYLGDPLDVSL